MATAAEIKKKIKKYTNCYFLRDGGNHEIWVNPTTGAQFTIPRHQSQEIPKGTANSIYKAAGLK